jgi:hypothetical protein
MPTEEIRNESDTTTTATPTRLKSTMQYYNESGSDDTLEEFFGKLDKVD